MRRTVARLRCGEGSEPEHALSFSASMKGGAAANPRVSASAATSSTWPASSREVAATLERRGVSVQDPEQSFVRAPSFACGRRASPRSACRCEQQMAIADSTAEWLPSSSQKTSMGATRAIAPKSKSATRAQARAHPLRLVVLTPVMASRIWHTLPR